MTLIICRRKECMYHALMNQCKAHAIGIDENGCDTYMKISEILREKMNEKTKR